MDPFEYVVVLTSLILGLGIAQILTSLADILSNLKHVKLSISHGLLTATVFFLHIQEWWINYEYSQQIKIWTLPIILVILTYPILLFLLARMLFPTGIRGHETDLDSYYRDQWPWFFGIAFGTMMISIWQNMFLQKLPLLDSWPQIAFGSIYLIMLILRIQKKWIHIAIQALWLLGLLGYMITDDRTLNQFMN